MTTLMLSHDGSLSARSAQAFSFSRCGVHPRHVRQREEKRRNYSVRRQGKKSFALVATDGWARTKEERKKEAERRKTLIRILRALRRVRLPAFHRGSCQRDASPQGSASGQASWDAGSTGVTRCLLSQSSGSTPRTGRNAGEHDARSRPGVAVTSRHARVPHPAPISRCRRLTSFHDERE